MGNSARPALIAVIGDAWLPESDTRLELAEECGKAVIEAGYYLVTGGLGGIMEAACRGAHQAVKYRHGCVIGLLPGLNPAEANPFVDIAIATGLELGRNLIVANSSAIIAIGGGPGTLAEMALGWQLGRLIVALNVDGWSGQLAGKALDKRRRRNKEVSNDRIYGVTSASEAVELINELLPKYPYRFKGIKPHAIDE